MITETKKINPLTATKPASAIKHKAMSISHKKLIAMMKMKPMRITRAAIAKIIVNVLLNMVISYS